jgi:site-specific recombinase XerC
MNITLDTDLKRAKSPWRKTWTTFGGKQKRKWFTTEAKAKSHVDSGNVSSKRIGTDLAVLPKRDRHAALLATTLAKENGFNLVDAARFYIAHNEIKDAMLFSDAEVLFHKSRSGMAKRTQSTRKSTLGAFRSFRDQYLSDYTRGDIEEFLSQGDVANRTRHNWLEQVNTFFNWAVRKKLVSGNPAKAIDAKQDLGALPPNTITFLTFDEVERLMRTALKYQPQLIPYFVLGIFCGIRPSEITGEGGKQHIDWADITMGDPDEPEEVAEVNVPSTSSKTSEPRQVELSENAQAWLRLGGELPPKGIQSRRIEVYTKAGVKWENDIMRHTFATMHCRMYRQPERLKLEMGHAENSRTLYNHYRSGRVKLIDAKRFWTLMPYEILDMNTQRANTQQSA